MDLEVFAKRLRDARLARGLTQSKLARLADLPEGTVISRYERGEHAPQVDSLARLASTLSVPLEWLTGKGGASVPRKAA